MAGLSYFLDFCFGFPNSHIKNTGAIFFRYILFLARRRLKIDNPNLLAHLDELKKPVEGIEGIEGINPIEMPRDKGFLLARQIDAQIVEESKAYITYEHALGFCSICTNTWACIVSFSILKIFVFEFGYCDIFHLICIIILSHVILRKLL